MGGIGAGRLVLVLALLASPGVVASAEAQDAPRPLEVEDLFRLRSVGSPRVSPEGRWVAYTVAKTDLEEDERETRIWMAPFDGGEAIPMTAEGTSASAPRWSPDGRWLSFLASRGE